MEADPNLVLERTEIKAIALLGDDELIGIDHSKPPGIPPGPHQSVTVDGPLLDPARPIDELIELLERLQGPAQIVRTLVIENIEMIDTQQ